MHGLVVKSPFIDDILNGIKKWEVRGMNTHIRGSIVLLKSGSGLALGTVNIIEVQELTLEKYNRWEYRTYLGKEPAIKLPYKKTFAYVLEEPKWFTKPIPYKHPIGAITWVNLPNDLLDE